MNHPDPSTSATKWRTRPVFISGTFADMHAERDALVDVWTELEQRALSLRLYLEWIDLRAGVDSVSVSVPDVPNATPEQINEAKHLHVLKICLDEIERSRPFLVVVLGDRYGWIPPADRSRRVAQEKGYFADTAGLSITELEVAFGAFQQPRAAISVYFYFRQPLFYDGMDPQTQAIYRDPPESEQAKRLNSLKDRIKAQFPDRWREYPTRWDAEANAVTGFDKLREMVCADLWDALQRDARDVQFPATSEGEEREALEQFIARQTRDFRGRTALLNDLQDAAICSASTGICLVGASGSGKSSVFGRLVQMLRERFQNGEIVVLAHAAGTTPRSWNIDEMLRRWVSELVLLLDKPSPVTPESRSHEIRQAFEELLAEVAVGRRVVLAIDSLDQFEPTSRAQWATWLPPWIPHNVWVFTTSADEKQAAALVGRLEQPFVELRLEPLSTARGEDAAAIIDAVCRRYHRTLNPTVSDILLSRAGANGTRCCEQPLWLTLAVEGLNLLDSDDFISANVERSDIDYDARLVALMQAIAAEYPVTATGMYNNLLARAEKTVGSALVRGFASLICISSFGMRESDLRVLLPEISGEPWCDMRFAYLRRAFRAHLMTRGMERQLDFVHLQMRESVTGRYLGDDAVVLSLHRRIARHLEPLVEPRGSQRDPAASRDLMRHLLLAGEYARAAKFLSSRFSPEDKRLAIGALVEHVVTRHSGNDEVMLLLDDHGLSPFQRTMLLNNISYLSGALEIANQLPEAIAILERALAEVKRELRSNSLIHATWVANHLTRLSGLYQATGQLNRARALYDDWKNADPGRAQPSIDDPEELRHHAEFLMQSADQTNPETALGTFRSALQVLEPLRPENCGDLSYAPDLVVALCELAEHLDGMDRSREAIDPAFEAADLIQRVVEYYPNHRFQMETLRNGEKRIMLLFYRVMLLIGELGVRSRQHETAIEYLTAAKKAAISIETLMPDDPDHRALVLRPLDCLSRVLAGVGRVTEAVEAIELRLARAHEMAEERSNYNCAREYVLALNDVAVFHFDIRSDTNEANQYWRVAHSELRGMLEKGYELDPQLQDLYRRMEAVAQPGLATTLRNLLSWGSKLFE